MKLIFKPICGNCGHVFKRLEYRKFDDGRVYISPPFCEKCEQTITQIKIPSFDTNGFTYEEEAGSNDI